MLSLGGAPLETPESSQHCFFSAQTRKHLLRKQTISEKNKRETKTFPQQMFRARANVVSLNVPVTVFPRLWGPRQITFGFFSIMDQVMQLMGRRTQ